MHWYCWRVICSRVTRYSHPTGRLQTRRKRVRLLLLEHERLDRKRIYVSPSRTPLLSILGLLLAVAAPPSAAQLRLDVLPEAALPGHQRSASTASALSLPATTSRSFTASTSSWLGSAIQLEEPRATSTGQYTRPKFHVGIPSETMRGFMNSAGFDTDKCQLPMVRARTKSNGDGNINGTLWLFARCTFR